MNGSVIVIGSTDVGRRTCDALRVRGVDILHLANPSDAELFDLLQGDVIGVAVMLHNDIEALRYSLAIEHIKPGVRLFVAIFDRSVRHEMERTIPNCFVASPAYISIPSVIAAALLPEHSALVRLTATKNVSWELTTVDNEDVAHQKFHIPTKWRRQRWLSIFKGQFRSYDSASRALLGGLGALVATLITDIVILQRHQPFSRAFYSASAVISGVSAPETPTTSWQYFQSGTFMLLTVIFVAIFGAGMVNHVLTGRRAGLVGRRVIPRGGHLVVVGLGQVGVRLCKELSLLKVPVVAIEQDANAPGVFLARDVNIPVVIGNASDVRTLNRAQAGTARAILAMGSDEQQNIAVSVAARAITLDTPIILRAGNDDAIAETQSLFSIGVVTDVNGLTAAYVTESLLAEPPLLVFPQGGEVASIDAGYRVSRHQVPGRCTCFSQ